MIWTTYEISQHPVPQSCRWPWPEILGSLRSLMGAESAVGPRTAPCQQQICDNVHEVQQHLPCSNAWSLEMAAFWCQIPLRSLLWLTLTWWRRKWQPTPVLLPGESNGQRSLAGCSSWGHKESDTTEQLNTNTNPNLEPYGKRTWGNWHRESHHTMLGFLLWIK